MPNFFKFAGAVVAGGWLMVGCSTTPHAPRDAQSAAETGEEGKAETVERLSDQEVERRAEAHTFYSAALLHDWNEEWDQAKDDYYKAAQIDPSDEPLVLEASQRLLQLKDLLRAEEILTNAAAQSTASGALLSQLGRVQFMTGKKELAIQSNRAALRKSPKLIAAYRNLAQIYLQDRQYGDGVKLLDQAARQSDVSATYLIELGELYMAFIPSGSNLNVKARAVEVFKRAAELKPTNPFHALSLADSFVMLGEMDQALQLYLEILKKHPVLPGLREKLAGLYFQKQDRQHAAEQLQAILRDNPTHAQANFLLGSIAFKDKKMPEAIDYFKKTMMLSPDFEPVYYDLAAAELSHKEPQAALETLEKARDKFKPNFVLEYYSALAFSQLKDYMKVVNHLTAAEVIARGSNETNRLDHFYYFQLGAAYERSQKFTEAEKYLRRCLEQSPDFSEALNYLGYMWAERGTNLTEACAMIEKALKAEPKNAAFLDSLGWVLFKMGKNREALKCLLQASEYLEEPDATIYDHIGDVYAALDQPAKAREAWQKAFSLEPKPEIQKKLRSSATSKAEPQ